MVSVQAAYCISISDDEDEDEAGMQDNLCSGLSGDEEESRWS